MTSVPETFDPNLVRAWELRNAVLEYFMEAKLSRRIDLVFSQYPREDVRRMLQACARTGLIWAVRGSGPGTVYETTDDGILTLKFSKAHPIKPEYLSEEQRLVQAPSFTEHMKSKGRLPFTPRERQPLLHNILTRLKTLLNRFRPS